MKNLKLFLIQLVLVMVMLFSIKPVSALEKLEDRIYVDIDKTTGSEFLNQVMNSSDDLYIQIVLTYANEEEESRKLIKFENEVMEASKYNIAYDIYDSRNVNFCVGQFKDGRYYKNYLLNMKTNKIKEIETSKYAFDIDKTGGKEFLKKIHSAKGDNKIILEVKYKDNKKADKNLKKFADKVKKVSKYHLNYGIYTKNDKDSFITKDGYTIIVLAETTKDMNACETLVSKIKNWNKLSDTDKFLKLSAICNSRSEYAKPGTDFHFYKKNNKLVCIHYAAMYKRILEMITYKGKAELIIKQSDGVNHELVLIKVDNNYYEGNNNYLLKNFECEKLSFRDWYKSNPKEFGKTTLEKEFIKANDI